MVVPRLSQETLAEMVGTTRSRVSFFMNRFRKLGFINYDVGDNLRVHSSLLNVVLHDDDGESSAPAARTQLPGQKRFQNRLQSTASSSIGTVQSGRLFLEFQGVGSNAPSNNLHCRESKSQLRLGSSGMSPAVGRETSFDAMH